jgi:transposase
VFRFDPELKVYLHREAIDFRVGLNGLAVLVEQVLGMNPFEQALFVFRNKRRDRVKILGWQRNGFWLLMNQLRSYCILCW